MYTFWDRVVGGLELGGSHTGVRTSSSPCPRYLCLNIPRFVTSAAPLAKHPASMAAKLPVCPSPQPFG